MRQVEECVSDMHPRPRIWSVKAVKYLSRALSLNSFSPTGLPVQVRDAALQVADSMPRNEVNKQYFAQNADELVRFSFLFFFFVFFLIIYYFSLFTFVWCWGWW